MQVLMPWALGPRPLSVAGSALGLTACTVDCAARHERRDRDLCRRPRVRPRPCCRAAPAEWRRAPRSRSPARSSRQRRPRHRTRGASLASVRAQIANGRTRRRSRRRRARGNRACSQRRRGGAPRNVHASFLGMHRCEGRVRGLSTSGRGGVARTRASREQATSPLRARFWEYARGRGGPKGGARSGMAAQSLLGSSTGRGPACGAPRNQRRPAA